MITVNNISKAFLIHHERNTTIFEDLKNIVKKNNYEKLWALKDINFNVKKGEFIGLIGENGSGKTTLLKVIAQILSPTKGKVEVNGSLTPFLELGIGFQEDLTVKDNVYLYGTLLGLEKEELNEKFDEIIGFAELKKFIDIKVKDLSTGMKARLAFSVAIQTDSEILLIDEVLAVGDLWFQQKCFKKFEEFKGNKTILFVSHDMNIIRKFCDKVLLLEQGKQIIFGDANKAVKEYLKKEYLKKMGYSNERRRFKEYISTIERDNELKQAYILNVLKKKGDKNFKLKEKKWGNKKVEILDVKFYNKTKKTNNFKSNAPMKIRIFYKNNKNIKDAIFGISIYSENGIQYYGTNSKKSIKLRKKGFVDLDIKKISMMEGRFFLSAAVHDKEHIHYDWHDKKYIFNVIKNNKDNGIINMECEWI